MSVKGRPATGGSWKKGVSPNPKGGPRRGESWAELIKETGKLDGPTVAQKAGFLAAQFRKLPAGISLKELVVLRVYGALIDDPQPGLLNAFMDRAEGKPNQPIDLSGDNVTRIIIERVDENNQDQDTPPAHGASPDQARAETF